MQQPPQMLQSICHTVALGVTCQLRQTNLRLELSSLVSHKNDSTAPLALRNSSICFPISACFNK
ncbi:Uncharacterised protein [Proteus mirabilis]|uniref:Uncharacterized protein n=1 Tax=Proteus mirabilis TaxID=584 RepID=A0A2X2BFY9_PROMI|nr:Uncharacterised protein [Proteus mirabilis]